MSQAATAPVQKESRLGKRPVDVPKGVKVAIAGSKVDVQGPKGKLTRVFPDQIAIALNGDVCNVTSSAPGTNGPRLPRPRRHGLSRRTQRQASALRARAFSSGGG